MTGPKSKRLPEAGVQTCWYVVITKQLMACVVPSMVGVVPNMVGVVPTMVVVVCCLNKAANGVVLVRKKKRTIRASCQPGLVPGQNSVKAVVTVSWRGMVTWACARGGGSTFTFTPA